MSRVVKLIGLLLALGVPSALALAQAPAPVPAQATPAAALPPAAAQTALPPPIMKAPPAPVSAQEMEYLRAEADFRALNYSRAYLELLPLAQRGDARAEFLIGAMSDNGMGPAQLNPAEAVRWYVTAAEKNNPDAQYALANAYASGRGGLPVDAKKSIDWLQKAASNGNMNAMFAMAGLLDSGAGGVQQNPGEATEWVKRAALAGSVNAIYLYAARVEQGVGVPANEKDALAWYRQAAMRGHPAAQLRLGMMVGNGENAVSTQNVESYMWLTLASQRGQGPVKTAAAVALRALQTNMLPSDITAAATLARGWQPLPQFAGLKPDPAFDLPGGLNVPAPPPKPASKPAAGAAAAGGKGG